MIRPDFNNFWYYLYGTHTFIDPLLLVDMNNTMVTKILGMDKTAHNIAACSLIFTLTGIQGDILAGILNYVLYFFS